MSVHSEENQQFGGNPKTLLGYLCGFSLSLLLTFLAFALVHLKLGSTTMRYFSLGGLALAQLLVQSLCFLGLNGGKEGRWNLLPFIFTLFIIVILAGGSLWIMYNLNYNMQ
jgi:cytochrome o ubiquinol oxidase operon protein cyoD